MARHNRFSCLRCFDAIQLGRLSGLQKLFRVRILLLQLRSILDRAKAEASHTGLLLSVSAYALCVCDAANWATAATPASKCPLPSIDVVNETYRSVSAAVDALLAVSLSYL